MVIIIVVIAFAIVVVVASSFSVAVEPGGSVDGFRFCCCHW